MTIQTELNAHIVENFLPGSSPDDLSPQDDLLETGVLDSMALMLMVTFLEERFGLAVAAEEIVPENFCSVAAIAAMVGRKRATA